MFKNFVILGFFLLVSHSSFAHVSAVDRLFGVAARHQGHQILQRHPFIEKLNKGTIRIENVAQFLQDRAYFVPFMEALLEKTEVPTLAPPTYFSQISDFFMSFYDPAQLEARRSELALQRVKNLLFFRSPQYQKEVQKLAQLGVVIPVSAAARQYGEYLWDTRQRGQKDRVAIHLWIFLIGETFGAQSMGGNIHSNFEELGMDMKDYEGFNLNTARNIVNDWLKTQITEGEHLDTHLKTDSDTDSNTNLDTHADSNTHTKLNSHTDLNTYKEEIGTAYDYLIQTFYAADEAPQKGNQGIEYSATYEKTHQVRSHFKDATYEAADSGHGRYFTYVTDTAGLVAIRQRDFQNRLQDCLNSEDDFRFLTQEELILPEMTVEEFIREYFPEIGSQI